MSQRILKVTLFQYCELDGIEFDVELTSVDKVVFLLLQMFQLFQLGLQLGLFFLQSDSQFNFTDSINELHNKSKEKK